MEEIMSVEIRVPVLGESIVDATIASWLKHEGDAVQQGDPLVELETDKVNVEVPAEQDGVLQKIVKQAGEVVAVGDVLGLLDEHAKASSNGATSQRSAVAAEPPSQGTPHEPEPSPVQPAALQHPSEAQRPPSPLARRIAAEYHVDLSQVQGSSPHGRVTSEDVRTYLQQREQPQPVPSVSSAVVAPPPGQPAQVPPRPQAPSNGTGASPAAPAAPAPQLLLTPRGREERIRMSRRRQTIAQRLVEAQQTAAMLTTFNEIDMSAVLELRSRRKDSFKERHNVSLGFMSFFTKATVGALKAFPRLNAEIEGNEIVLKYYYDIGIAVGAEEGLVVPVLRDADRKSFADIEREIAELAKRARENKLSLAELQGGTFTITNGGVFGSLLSTPILNAPQVGILGMHKIEQRPVVVSGQIVIRPMMYVALSYDHRIVDGREAVQFLVRIKELVEDPEKLLLEG
jgi:2-oxoglutarate dehydrogenase E2 component (dihydrolipoamide succinyltransferase)